MKPPRNASPPPSPPPPPAWGAAVLVIAALLLTGALCFALELVLRRGAGLTEVQDWGVVDPVVGHIPREGFSIQLPLGPRIRIGRHGTRDHGTEGISGPGLILAVGDSFTFGEGVSDDQTWPAFLQAKLDRRVINGGATGFGIDQTVLRAEQLVTAFAPDTIVVSFIPDDIWRAEMSCYSHHEKPWFEPLPDGSLRLHPANLAPSPSPLKRLLRRSLILQILAGPLLYSECSDRRVHSAGGDVACALMDRLARLACDPSRRVLLIGQPGSEEEPGHELAIRERVLTCAREAGLAVLDLGNSFHEARRPGLFSGHMTPAGNEWVAAQVAEALALPAPPRPPSCRTEVP